MNFFSVVSSITSRQKARQEAELEVRDGVKFPPINGLKVLDCNNWKLVKIVNMDYDKHNALDQRTLPGIEVRYRILSKDL